MTTILALLLLSAPVECEYAAAQVAAPVAMYAYDACLETPTAPGLCDYQAEQVGIAVANIGYALCGVL